MMEQRWKEREQLTKRAPIRSKRDAPDPPRSLVPQLGSSSEFPLETELVSGVELGEVGRPQLPGFVGVVADGEFGGFGELFGGF